MPWDWRRPEPCHHSAPPSPCSRPRPTFAAFRCETRGYVFSNLIGAFVDEEPQEPWNETRGESPGAQSWLVLSELKL